MPHGKPRDPRKEQLWRQRIQLWQGSGLPVRVFCLRHHLSVPSFYAWRRTLRQRDDRNQPTPTPATFLPLHIQPDDTGPTHDLELLLANGRCLRIPHGYDPAYLADLLRVLEAHPC